MLSVFLVRNDKLIFINADGQADTLPMYRDHHLAPVGDVHPCKPLMVSI